MSEVEGKEQKVEDPFKIFYECNGNVAGCSKRSCYKRGGECRHIADIKYARNFAQRDTKSNVWTEHLECVEPKRQRVKCKLAEGHRRFWKLPLEGDIFGDLWYIGQEHDDGDPYVTAYVILDSGEVIAVDPVHIIMLHDELPAEVVEDCLINSLQNDKEEKLNAAERYARKFAITHNLTLEQAMQQPMVQARFEVFQGTGW